MKEESKKNLNKSIQELETLLSCDLKKGIPTSEEKIKSIFECAAVARYKQLKASKLIAVKK